MNHGRRFLVQPDEKPRLAKVDPSFTGSATAQSAAAQIATNLQRIARLQFRLYAQAQQSLLIVLQGLDASGKDGAIRHLSGAMNPQGTLVHSFKQPTPEELAHDFLWRVPRRAPAHGQVAIFNRSHYEDVVVARVHALVPRAVWSKRYAAIVAFEKALAEHGTRILKFYLHIDRREQLERFRQRLEDPERQWKISLGDYTERELWPHYTEAYQDALALTSRAHAPWFVIPANHKWFRDLAIGAIVAETMERMGLRFPQPQVDLADIRRRYHEAQLAVGSSERGAARRARDAGKVE